MNANQSLRWVAERFAWRLGFEVSERGDKWTSRESRQLFLHVPTEATIRQFLLGRFCRRLGFLYVAPDAHVDDYYRNRIDKAAKRAVGPLKATARKEGLL